MDMLLLPFVNGPGKEYVTHHPLNESGRVHTKSHNQYVRWTPQNYWLNITLFDSQVLLLQQLHAFTIAIHTTTVLGFLISFLPCPPLSSPEAGIKLSA